MRTGPLFLVFRGLRNLGGRRRGWQGLKVQVRPGRDLGQGEGQLSRVAGTFMEAHLAAGPLQPRLGTSELASSVGGPPMLGASMLVLLMLLGVAGVPVGPGLGQGGHGVQAEARRPLVGRRVCDLGVAATALEASPQVVAGWPAGVGGGPIIDIQQGRASVHVWGEALWLENWGATLGDGGVVLGRDGGVALGRDGRVALGHRGVALVMNGRWGVGLALD